MTDHKYHHYSITVHTIDLAVLYCLRALADYAQKTGNTRITWGGTSKEDWSRNNKSVKFHFSKPEYREYLINEATRILPKGSWNEVSRNDNDPAVPKK